MPLGPVAWATFKATLGAAGRRPGELLGLTASEMAREFELTDDEAERIATLLSRAGPLAIALERLASLGIWISTLLDETYPPKLRDRLGDKAPPLLFGSGDLVAARQGGLAIIGSRDVDESAQEFAASIARAAANGGLPVISGAARGIDSVAMVGALEYGGTVVGVLAESLAKRIREPLVRSWLADGVLCLLTPYAPESGFSVGAAMGRNKLIYALSDAALVVSTAEGTGGTWAGATEALKARWTPVMVRQGDGAPAANQRLIERGALPFPQIAFETLTNSDLQAIVAGDGDTDKRSEPIIGGTVQDSLFGEIEPTGKPVKRKGRSRKSP